MRRGVLFCLLGCTWTAEAGSSSSCTVTPGYYTGAKYGWRCQNDWFSGNNGSASDKSYCGMLASHLDSVPRTTEWCIWEFNQACVNGGDSAAWCTSGNQAFFNNLAQSVDVQVSSKVQYGELLGRAGGQCGVCGADSCASATEVQDGKYLDKCATSSQIWRYGSLYGQQWSKSVHREVTSGTLSCPTTGAGSQPSCTPNDASGAQQWAYADDMIFIGHFKVVKCADVAPLVSGCCESTTLSDGTQNFYCKSTGSGCPTFDCFVQGTCTNPTWSTWKSGFEQITDYSMNYITTSCDDDSTTTIIIIVCCCIGGALLIGVGVFAVYWFKCRSASDTSIEMNKVGIKPNEDVESAPTKYVSNQNAFTEDVPDLSKQA